MAYKEVQIGPHGEPIPLGSRQLRGGGIAGIWDEASYPLWGDESRTVPDYQCGPRPPFGRPGRDADLLVVEL
jgi:hypothetical protein